MSSFLTSKKSAWAAIIAAALIATAGLTGSAVAAQKVCDDGYTPPVTVAAATRCLIMGI